MNCLLLKRTDLIIEAIALNYHSLCTEFNLMVANYYRATEDHLHMLMSPIFDISLHDGIAQVGAVFSLFALPRLLRTCTLFQICGDDTSISDEHADRLPGDALGVFSPNTEALGVCSPKREVPGVFGVLSPSTEALGVLSPNISESPELRKAEDCTDCREGDRDNKSS